MVCDNCGKQIKAGEIIIGMRATSKMFVDLCEECNLLKLDFDYILKKKEKRDSSTIRFE